MTTIDQKLTALQLQQDARNQRIIELERCNAELLETCYAAGTLGVSLIEAVGPVTVRDKIEVIELLRKITRAICAAEKVRT